MGDVTAAIFKSLDDARGALVDNKVPIGTIFIYLFQPLFRLSDPGALIAIYANAFGWLGCVGKPLDNCAVYLLNGTKEVVALGDIGEMHVVGAHVASGYVNNREKDRFNVNHIEPDRKGLLISYGSFRIDPF